MSEFVNMQAQTVKIRSVGLDQEQLTFSVPNTSARLSPDVGRDRLLAGTGQNDTVIIEMEPEAWLQEIDAVLARAELGIARESAAMTELLERLTLANA